MPPEIEPRWICPQHRTFYNTSLPTAQKVSVRPSGTEPKIKFYVEVKGHMETAADYDKAIEAADAKIEAIKKDLGIE